MKHPELTERESQALDLWMQGMIYREVGQEMLISNGRASQLLQAVRKKYNARTTDQLAALLTGWEPEDKFVHHPKLTELQSWLINLVMTGMTRKEIGKKMRMKPRRVNNVLYDAYLTYRVHSSRELIILLLTQ